LISLLTETRSLETLLTSFIQVSDNQPIVDTHQPPHDGHGHIIHIIVATVVTQERENMDDTDGIRNGQQVSSL
jgi:hypothetical protein